MMKIIGKNIKRMREEMGLNQVIIAQFLNVNQDIISKVEKGEVALSADMLEKLSCLFGVTTEAMKKDNLKPTSYTFNFKHTKLAIEDINAIYATNRIFMNTLLMKNTLKNNQT